ncbi:hypothetical protein AB0D59_05760 [Streptomyces sp. NPDC048417]|uniref:hypothetical protein n=1 Tax=Streptomyces sp. NPDC048417 TaxID=3155387 RepID=UPI003415D7CB
MVRAADPHRAQHRVVEGDSSRRRTSRPSRVWRSAGTSVTERAAIRCRALLLLLEASGTAVLPVTTTASPPIGPLSAFTVFTLRHWPS